MVSGWRLDLAFECQFVVWQMTLAECMPHLLSFGAL